MNYKRYTDSLKPDGRAKFNHMSYRAPIFVDQVDPSTKEPLHFNGHALVDSLGKTVAEVVDGIPRFVSPEHNYAESFGWQWKKWANNQSESRGATIKQRQLILERTHFDKYPQEGKTLLECGMGGGDDTEVLLTLSFSKQRTSIPSPTFGPTAAWAIWIRPSHGSRRPTRHTTAT